VNRWILRMDGWVGRWGGHRDYAGTLRKGQSWRSVACSLGGGDGGGMGTMLGGGCGVV
jgi:hypothetical protein